MDKEKWRMEYLSLAEERAGKRKLEYQLAVEFEWLCETFDRSGPHDMACGVAMPRGFHRKLAGQHALARKEQVRKLVKDMSLDSGVQRDYVKELYKMGYEQLTALYESYKDNYLLEGIIYDYNENSTEEKDHGNTAGEPGRLRYRRL